MFCIRLLACTIVLLTLFDRIFSIVKDDGIDGNRLDVRGVVEEGVFRDSTLNVWRRVDCVRGVFTGVVICVVLVLL